jgi:hypothetical protein
MDAPALVALLQSRGIMLSLSDGNLAVDHHGELTDADRDLIRTHKPTLLAALAPQSSPHKEAGTPKLSPHQMVRSYAPRGTDARRRYYLRLRSPLWPDGATPADYELAARLSFLHAKGACAYLNEWTSEDQALADRVMARRQLDSEGGSRP